MNLKWATAILGTLLLQQIGLGAGPAIVSASSFDGATVGIQFDQSLDETSATEEARYTVSANGTGFGIVSSRLNADGQSVTLRLTNEVLETALNVCATGVRSVSGEPGSSCGLARVHNMRAYHVGFPQDNLVDRGAIKNAGLQFVLARFLRNQAWGWTQGLR